MSLDLHRSSSVPNREEILKRAESLISVFKDRAEETETIFTFLKLNIIFGESINQFLIY